MIPVIIKAIETDINPANADSPRTRDESSGR